MHSFLKTLLTDRRLTVSLATGLAAITVGVLLTNVAQGRPALALSPVVLLGGCGAAACWFALSSRALYDRAVRHHITGLPNKTLLREILARAIARSARHGDSGIALLSLDIDSFKSVNDTYGHPFGDRVLKSVALRLSQSVRPGDVVAHDSGDEFFVFAAEATTREEARALSRRIKEMFAAPLVVDGRVLPVTLSVGVFCCPASGADLDTILQQVDDELYEAKKRRKAKKARRRATGSLSKARHGRR